MSVESREADKAVLAMRCPSAILTLNCSFFLSSGRLSMNYDIFEKILCVHFVSRAA